MYRDTNHIAIGKQTDDINIEKDFWIYWNIDFPIDVNVLRIEKDVFCLTRLNISRNSLWYRPYVTTLVYGIKLRQLNMHWRVGQMKPLPLKMRTFCSVVEKVKSKFAKQKYTSNKFKYNVKYGNIGRHEKSPKTSSLPVGNKSLQIQELDCAA